MLKRVDLKQQTLNPTFIGSWVINPLSLCDELITYFESNKDRQKAGITTGGKNLDSKNSTDILMWPNDINSHGNGVFEKYFENLFICYQDYVAQWPFLRTFAENVEIGNFNLQRYRRGEHFQKTHTERDSLDTLHRVFAWMTYLNDVDIEDGGSTCFNHYNLEVQPKKGLTLIWPADWTHAHKGNLLTANSKYIITGWMHFPSN